ncbi:MAG: potassium-transporting ATPase subunit KdpC [Alphaproteobacteria bacterium]|nr:potassium-transporting ATPase subunit KdpC [Alphaproteobacteria bacterium]
MQTLTGSIRPALCLLLVLTLICGVCYPLVCFGILHVFFPNQSQGSLLHDKQGNVRGSALIGQPFSDPSHFWARPSATLHFPYNASASNGSNLSVNNIQLWRLVAYRANRLRAWSPTSSEAIPVDLVTASASGLDPHISMAAALYQVPRIANIRHKKEEEILELVRLHREPRPFNLFGEPRVNVLKLNMALDGIQ